MTDAEGVALSAYASLLRQGVREDYAAMLADEVGRHVVADPEVPELFAIRMTDRSGAFPHAAIMTAVPAGKIALFKFDIRGHRERVREAAQ